MYIHIYVYIQILWGYTVVTNILELMPRQQYTTMKPPLKDIYIYIFEYFLGIQHTSILRCFKVNFLLGCATLLNTGWIVFFYNEPQNNWNDTEIKQNQTSYGDGSPKLEWSSTCSLLTATWASGTPRIPALLSFLSSCLMSECIATCRSKERWHWMIQPWDLV